MHNVEATNLHEPTLQSDEKETYLKFYFIILFHDTNSGALGLFISIFRVIKSAIVSVKLIKKKHWTVCKNNIS